MPKTKHEHDIASVVRAFMLATARRARSVEVDGAVWGVGGRRQEGGERRDDETSLERGTPSASALHRPSIPQPSAPCYSIDMNL